MSEAETPTAGMRGTTPNNPVKMVRGLPKAPEAPPNPTVTVVLEDPNPENKSRIEGQTAVVILESTSIDLLNNTSSRVRAIDWATKNGISQAGLSDTTSTYFVRKDGDYNVYRKDFAIQGML
jgi:hypothetical protein